MFEFFVVMGIVCLVTIMWLALDMYNITDQQEKEKEEFDSIEQIRQKRIK